MTGDTYVEQLVRTEKATGDAVRYYGVALFGDADLLAPHTKRLSLWK
jgi:hypothetical protein